MSRFAVTTLPIGLALGLVATAANAQTVYRCGPAGNQYSQQPCAEGRVVDVSDPRSAAQTAEARAAVRDQHRLATEMARERRAEEAAHRPAMAGGIPLRSAETKTVKAVEKRPKKKKGAVRNAVYDGDPHEFVAMAPGSGKKKQKAQD
jgi:hypothetical protein